MSLEDPWVPLCLQPVLLWAMVQGCGAAPHPLSCPCLPISPQSTGVQAEDVDGLLLGMSSQIAEREDNILVEDLQGLCSPKPQLARFFWGGTLSPGAMWGTRRGGRSRPAVSTQPLARSSFSPVMRGAEEPQGMRSTSLGPSSQGHGGVLYVQQGPWQGDKAS